MIDNAFFVALFSFTPLDIVSRSVLLRYPFSAIVCAYSPEHYSLTAPNGPLTAIAGYFPNAFFGLYKSAASVIP